MLMVVLGPSMLLICLTVSISESALTDAVDKAEAIVVGVTLQFQYRCAREEYTDLDDEYGRITPPHPSQFLSQLHFHSKK